MVEYRCRNRYLRIPLANNRTTITIVAVDELKKRVSHSTLPIVEFHSHHPTNWVTKKTVKKTRLEFHAIISHRSIRSMWIGPTDGQTFGRWMVLRFSTFEIPFGNKWMGRVCCVLGRPVKCLNVPSSRAARRDASKQQTNGFAKTYEILWQSCWMCERTQQDIANVIYFSRFPSVCIIVMDGMDVLEFSMHDMEGHSLFGAEQLRRGGTFLKVVNEWIWSNHASHPWDLDRAKSVIKAKLRTRHSPERIPQESNRMPLHSKCSSLSRL